MNSRGPIDFARPLRVLVGATLCVVVAVTLLQIALRYLFNAPLIWSEELVKLLIVWLAFIGAAVVCWDGRHLNVDVLLGHMPPRVRACVRALNAVISIGFLVILAWTSIKLVRIENAQMLSTLPLPAGVIRLAATVGAVLMIAAVLGRIFYLRPRRRADDPDYGQEESM